MRFLIMTNGEYGDLNWYRGRAGRFDRIYCVDGGSRRAKQLGVVPDRVVGDMDSITGADRHDMENNGVRFSVFPPEKDYTDTQLALDLAVREGAREIVVWGGTGSRLDHTLSNLCSSVALVRRGVGVFFEAPDVDVYLVRDRLLLPGKPGDTVSLIVLGDRATGVTLHDFRYPLEGVVLEGSWQWAVSNVVTGTAPAVRVATGVLAVFHYKRLSP